MVVSLYYINNIIIKLKRIIKYNLVYMIIRTYNNKLVNIEINQIDSDFELYQLILYLKYNIKLPSNRLDK